MPDVENKTDSKKKLFNWLHPNKDMLPDLEVTILDGDDLDSGWAQWDLATRLLDSDFGKLT